MLLVSALKGTSLLHLHRESPRSRCWRGWTPLRPTCPSSGSSCSALPHTFCAATVIFEKKNLNPGEISVFTPVLVLVRGTVLLGLVLLTLLCSCSRRLVWTAAAPDVQPGSVRVSRPQPALSARRPASPHRCHQPSNRQYTCLMRFYVKDLYCYIGVTNVQVGHLTWTTLSRSPSLFEMVQRFQTGSSLSENSVVLSAADVQRHQSQSGELDDQHDDHEAAGHSGAHPHHTGPDPELHCLYAGE